MEWIQNYPGELDVRKKTTLIEEVCRAFDISEQGIYATISGIDLPKRVEVARAGEQELAAILPKGGWFERYITHTARTESPLSFHVFSSLCAISAALGRRTFLDWGFFRIYPNACVVLIGPTGRVRKTSAVEVAQGLVRKAALCPIFADKITPEAVPISMAAKGGHQFLYAPEFSVFFGKQKYNEGLTTLFLRLLDCPGSFEVETVSRGPLEVTNVALTILGCSTMSLFTDSTPQEVTSSGFMNRFLMIVEQDTDRIFPKAYKGVHEDWLVKALQRLQTFTGEVVLDPLVNPNEYAWYEEWYHARRRRMRTIDDERTLEAVSRGETHVLRLAMQIHLAECDNTILCLKCLGTAAALLKYVEDRVPTLVRSIGKTSHSIDSDYVVEKLRKLGGAAAHSKLLSRVSDRMDANTMKRHIGSLVEQGLIKAEKKGALQYYILREVDNESSS